MATETDMPNRKLSHLITESFANIQAHWPVLPSGIWNASGIRPVLRYLGELTRRSRQAGLIHLHEHSQTIDKLINDIDQAGTQPKTADIHQLNQLYEELKKTVSKIQASGVVQDSAEIGYDLIYLHKNNTHDDQISDAIKQNGWRVLSLETIDSILSALSKQNVKVILIDTQYIQEIEEVNRLVDQLRNLKIRRPELIFLTQECDIEIRLKALRTGVTQCFSKPVSIKDLMVSIKQMISPEIKSPHRVLIVEDDESQAKFASTLLRKGGLKTLSITDPLSVIEAVKRFQPDLILMDLYMPGANGIELTRVIREKAELLTIPIVFLSGEDDMDKKLLALNSGADDFLTKPVRPQHLLATVKTRINRAQVIFSAGTQGHIDYATGLNNRRVFLEQLEHTCQETATNNNNTVAGLFSITCADPEQYAPSEKFNHILLDIAKSAMKLIDKNDIISRASEHSLGILVKRNSIEEIEQTGNALYNQAQSVLAHQPNSEDKLKFGIGLTLIETAQEDADLYLAQSDAASLAAFRQQTKGYLSYQAQPDQQTSVEQSPDDFQKLQFQNALNTNLIEFQKQTFNAAHHVDKEMIELIPVPAPATDIILVSNDIFLTAHHYNLSREFDRYLVEYALTMLGKIAFAGIPTQILISLSANAMHDTSMIEFIKSQLRKRQQVGTGLVIEFNLPTLAKNLKKARLFLGDLSALGIDILLGNFACNETAYKVLAYLNANGVRPHISMMKAGVEQIHDIATHVHSLHAMIVLPRVEKFSQISLYWSEAADFVQASYDH
jgi:DNA-binding response OmpR family regulator